MKCANCHYDNSPSARNCAKCGAPLALPTGADDGQFSDDVKIYTRAADRSAGNAANGHVPASKSAPAGTYRTASGGHRAAPASRKARGRSSRRRSRKSPMLVLAVILLVLLSLSVIAMCLMTFTTAGQRWKASRGMNAPASAYWQLGDEAAREGNTDQALSYYESAFSRDPDSYEGAIKLAQALETSGNTERAERAYRKAISLIPNLRLPYDELLRLMKANDADSSSMIDLLQLAYQNTSDETYRTQLNAYIPSSVRFDPEEGTYDTPVLLQMASQADSQIYYTTDGSTPTVFSQHYTEPVELSEGTYTVKAISYNNGLYSGEASHTYTIVLPKVESPAFTSQPGKYESDESYGKTITVVVPEGCTVYYTTDGTTPTTSSTVYGEEGIRLGTGKFNVQLLAVDADNQKSAVVSAEYTVLEKLKEPFNDSDQFLSFRVGSTTLDNVGEKFKNVLNVTGDRNSVFTQEYRFGEVTFTVVNGTPVVTSVIVRNDDITAVRGTMVNMDVNDVINLFRNEQQKINGNEKPLYSDPERGDYGWCVYNDEHDIVSVNYQYERDGAQLVELHYTIRDDRVIQIEYCVSDK